MPDDFHDILILTGRLRETARKVLHSEVARSRVVIWIDADSGEATLLKDNTASLRKVTHKDLR